MGEKEEKNEEKTPKKWGKEGKRNGKRKKEQGIKWGKKEKIDKEWKIEEKQRKNGICIIFCNNLYSDSRESDCTQSDVVIKYKNIIIRNYSNFFE